MLIFFLRIAHCSEQISKLFFMCNILCHMLFNISRFFPSDPPVIERVHLARDRAVGEREVDARTHDQLRQRSPTLRTAGLELHRVARPRFSQ
jgi:hypothetical protein